MKDDGWEHWEELAGSRTKSRMGIYTGKELRMEIAKRAARVREKRHISDSGFVRACVINFIRSHPEDADPRK